MSALELLRSLISFDTVAPEGRQYEDLVRFVKEWFEERGIATAIEYVDEVYKAKACPVGGPRPILFAWVGEGEPLLEFNGHYDVVPPGEGWTGNPFEARVEGEYVIGRGASDMKGGLASIMLAMERLSSWKGPKVQAVFVPDEEVGGLCGTAYRVRHLSSKYPVGKHVVIAEPSGPKVWVGHKGVVWLEVTVKGKQAHASAPWEGDNAFLKASNLALKLYTELLQRFSKRVSKYEYTSGHPMAKMNTVNIGGRVAVSSLQPNVIPGEAKFSVDIRVIPEERAVDVAKEVEEVVGKEGAVKAIMVDEPFLNERAEIAKVIEERWGHPPVVCEGGLDLRFYRGYDAVAWGPGMMEEAHKVDEKVRLKDVEEWAKMYSELPHLLS